MDFLHDFIDIYMMDLNNQMFKVNIVLILGSNVKEASTS